MKPLLSLTAWNWRMFQKPYALLLALTAGVELALLCAAAARRQNAFYNCGALFMGSGAWLVFPLAYLAAILVSLYPLAQAGGKTRAGCTLLTLPLPRSTLLLGQILATALALLVLIAWQAALCVALYWPASVLQAWRAGGLAIALPAGQGLFYRGMLRNLLLRMLVPTGLPGLAVLAAAVAAPAVLAPGALYQKGWRRVLALCLGLAGAWCCVMLLLVALYCLMDGYGFVQKNHGILFSPLIGGALAAIVAVSYVWSLHSLRRADAF